MPKSDAVSSRNGTLGRCNEPRVMDSFHSLLTFPVYVLIHIWEIQKHEAISMKVELLIRPANVRNKNGYFFTLDIFSGNINVWGEG